jgi:hypothetical protein
MTREPPNSLVAGLRDFVGIREAFVRFHHSIGNPGQRISGPSLMGDAHREVA